MFEGLLQPSHLLLVLVISIVVFGPKRLPEIGKGLGEAIRGFKNSFRSEESAPAAPPAGVPSRPPGEPDRGSP